MNSDYHKQLVAANAQRQRGDLVGAAPGFNVCIDLLPKALDVIQPGDFIVSITVNTATHQKDVVLLRDDKKLMFRGLT